MIHITKGYAMPPGSDANAEYGGFGGWVQADAKLYNNAVSPVGTVPPLNGLGRYAGTEEILSMNGVWPEGGWQQAMQTNLNGYPQGGWQQAMQLNDWVGDAASRAGVGVPPPVMAAVGSVAGYLFGDKIKLKPVHGAVLGALAGYAVASMAKKAKEAKEAKEAQVRAMAPAPRPEEGDPSIDGYPQGGWQQAMQLNGYGRYAGPEEVLDIDEGDTDEVVMSTLKADGTMERVGQQSVSQPAVAAPARKPGALLLGGIAAFVAYKVLSK